MKPIFLPLRSDGSQNVPILPGNDFVGICQAYRSDGPQGGIITDLRGKNQIVSHGHLSIPPGQRLQSSKPVGILLYQDLQAVVFEKTLVVRYGNQTRIGEGCQCQ